MIKLSIFSTLLGDLNTLDCLSLTMLLFSRSRPNFYGFSWVFRGFNRKTKINALLILHVLVIVFLPYTARTGFVFMPFWKLTSILVQDPPNSPAVSRFTMRPFQLGSCSCDAESRGAAVLPSKQQLPRQLPSQGSSHSRTQPGLYRGPACSYCNSLLSVAVGTCGECDT